MSDVQVSYYSLQHIENAVERISSQVAAVGDYVSKVDQEVQEVKRQMKIEFEKMAMNAALQRAITEVIRVRQELEQKFGNHEQVRNNFRGILQTTDPDVALVTKETIAKIGEEIMLSAPKYWLAPCLVAVAAWINNKETLASRAIKEAIRRDEVKAPLLFALVVSRVARSELKALDTLPADKKAKKMEVIKKREAIVFEWLALYFGKQNPERMTRSVTAFIDAYANGAFGVDEKKVCQETIDAWVAKLAADENFDKEQKEYWKDYFDQVGATAAYHSNGYDALRSLSKDFTAIDSFVKRITSVNNEGGAKDKINGVMTQQIDVQKLIDKIDEQLVLLITEYDEDETDLRNEETELQLIKKYKGDEKRAKAVMERDRLRRLDIPVDFVTRLQDAIRNPEAPIESQKTAYFLLQRYISSAYKEYITENKDAYPEEINLDINEYVEFGNVNWHGTTKNGENLTDMENAVKQVYEENKQKAIELATPSKAKLIVVGIFTLGIGTLVLKNKFKKKKALIEYTYDTKSKAAVERLNAAVNARIEANNIVNDFISKDNWDTIELKVGASL